jgi:CRP/FNR family cyclic AMP-dependent transcriptional regulator
MARTDPTTVLKSVPLFQGLSRGELKEIAEEAREELFSPNQDIVQEGQSGGPFFCITEGRADILVKDKKVGDLGPGSYFGEMSLLEGGARSATIRATTHVKALAISSWNFMAILKENFDITKKVLAELSRRVRELEQTPHA